MELLRVVWEGGCVPEVQLRKWSDSSEAEKRRRGAVFMSRREGQLQLQQVCRRCISARSSTICASSSSMRSLALAIALAASYNKSSVVLITMSLVLVLVPCRLSLETDRQVCLRSDIPTAAESND